MEGKLYGDLRSTFSFEITRDKGAAERSGDFTFVLGDSDPQIGSWSLRQSDTLLLLEVPGWTPEAFLLTQSHFRHAGDKIIDHIFHYIMRSVAEKEELI